MKISVLTCRDVAVVVVVAAVVAVVAVVVVVDLEQDKALLGLGFDRSKFSMFRKVRKVKFIYFFHKKLATCLTKIN